MSDFLGLTLNEPLIYVKHLQQLQEHSKYKYNMSYY